MFRVITRLDFAYGVNFYKNVIFRTLWNQGGVLRFYRGFGPALLQAPISRFGDTASNIGILTLLERHDLPLPIKTGAASLTAGLWRIAIMPIDAVKTTLQVSVRLNCSTKF